MTDGEPDLDSLLAELRATVAERRARGEFPAGLEDELDAHFRRIAAARPALTSLEPLRAQIDGLLTASRFSAARIPTGSSAPGGATLHRSLARLFARQAEGILQQVQEFADRTRETLAGMADLLADANTHVHQELAGVVDAHTEILAGRERFPDQPADRLDDLSRRVEALERSRAASQWKPWFSRERFEAVFGDQEDSEVEAAVAEALEGSSSALVLAPDSPAPDSLAARLGARLGAAARAVPAGQDPVAALGAVPEGELDGIVVLRADAHLGPGQLIELVGLAPGKLRPGGRLMVSWRDDGPMSLRYDPTLAAPLPVDYLAFVCREAGFAEVSAGDRPGPTKLIIATR